MIHAEEQVVHAGELLRQRDQYRDALVRIHAYTSRYQYILACEVIASSISRFLDEHEGFDL